jgi:hypothetical protein
MSSCDLKTFSEGSDPWTPERGRIEERGGNGTGEEVNIPMHFESAGAAPGCFKNLGFLKSLKIPKLGF